MSSFTPGGSNKNFTNSLSGLIVGSGGRGGFSQVKPRFSNVSEMPLRPHSLIAIESNNMECDNTSLGDNESLSPMATGNKKLSQSKQDYKYLMDIILKNSNEQGPNIAATHQLVSTSVECEDKKILQSPTLTANTTNTAATSNFSIFNLDNYTAPDGATSGADPGGGGNGTNTSTTS